MSDSFLTPSKGSKSRVQVVIRARPQTTQELKDKLESVVDLNEPEGQVIVALEKTFAFDSCYSSDVTQEDIYRNVAANTVQNFVNHTDSNATILAYGQTGAGKTYTMLGNDTDQGIIPRALKDIFRSADPETDSVGISFYEIHNEKVFDLLSQSQLKVPLNIREEYGDFYLPQLKQQWTDSLSDALALLERGLKIRSIGSTALNENSSRSHAVFRISLSRQIDDSSRIEGKLSLVDLAGSESVRKTNAHGERLTEANNINKGLLALGNCVSDICANRSHIPFRNSTLTKVLRECLHGEGYTTMIACISPTENDLTETLNTLRYANRAKNMQKPPIPSHLLQFASAKKRKFASRIPPTPAKYIKLNNTLGPSTPSAALKRPVTTPKLNATVACSRSSSVKNVPSFSESLENISESEETMSEISSIYPPSSSKSVTSKIASEMGNMTVLDSTILSPIIRRVLSEREDRLFAKIEMLEETLKHARKTKTPKRSSPVAYRRSPRLNNSNLLEETLISGPAFTETRQKMRVSTKTVEMDEDVVISSKPFSALKDVTNVAEKMRRKSQHREKVEQTASPDLCRNSLEEKENEEAVKMAKSMGIDLDMFDDFDAKPKSVQKPKRSVRRTTMLPPELNKTLNESFKDRRRSSRLEALNKFKNPLEVKSNWQIFDQDKHNTNILTMLNSANLQMLQKIPAIGPKTAFLLHTHRELHGQFHSFEDLKTIPGLQKSFFNKFTKTHQVVL